VGTRFASRRRLLSPAIRSTGRWNRSPPLCGRISRDHWPAPPIAVVLLVSIHARMPHLPGIPKTHFKTRARMYALVELFPFPERLVSSACAWRDTARPSLARGIADD